MNAYELADELKYFHETLCDTGAINAVISGLKVKQLETMLRQQADTIYKHMELITELRKECNARADRIAELEKAFVQARVANFIEGEYGQTITHLVKQLSDEEITNWTVKIYECRTGAEAHEIVLGIIKEITE